MLDLILIICIIGTAIGGISYLVLPPDKLIKKENLKNGETMEEATKRIRKNGYLYIGIALFLFLTNFGF